MTINNAELYVAGQWDWAILDGCFGGTKIKPTDIDGCIERKGKCLYLETKKPGARIPDAQQYTHRTWVRQGNSVIVVWGDTNEPQRIEVFSPRYPDGKVYPFADIETLRHLVSAWFTKVDGGQG